MRAHGVEVPTPAFDHDLRFGKGVEHLAVEQLVAEAGVEAFDVAVFPWAAGRDEGGLRADGLDPGAHRTGDELRAVVRTHEGRRAAQDEQVGQHIDDIRGVELSVDPHTQRLPSELVDDVQDAVLAPVMGAILDEVIGPHVVRALRAQADARAVIEPQP